MKRLTTLATALLWLSISGIALAADPAMPAKKSAVQEMMDQAEKALDQADVATGGTGGGRPIVVPGAKPVQLKAVAPSTGARVNAVDRPGATVEKEAPPAVKIVEGTGTSKTKLAPESSMPSAPSDVLGQYTSSGQYNLSPEVSSHQIQARTPVSSTGLPGLGSPVGSGAGGTAKPIAIQAQNGVNEMVTVSAMMPNRIATPFANPKVVDFSANDYQVVGSDVFVVPKGKEPIGIFIRDDRPDSPTVALTLVPRQIPGVTVLVNIDGAYRGAAKSQARNQDDEPDVSSYEDMLRKMMRRLVLEKPMSGYTETNLDTGVAMIGPLRVIPEKQLSGQTFDIYRYRIVNTSKEPFELSEESFYQRGVKAVAFYPALRIDAWKSTKVFIVAGKNENEVDDER